MENPRGYTIYSKENRKQIMGKHLDKMTRALAQRQAATYASGEKKPGSMNVKKTGYRGQRAKGPKAK